MHILEFLGMFFFVFLMEFVCYLLFLKGLKSLERGVDYRSILQISGALLEGVLFAWVLVYAIYKNFLTDKTKQPSRWVVFLYYSICIILFLWTHGYWWFYSAEVYKEMPKNIPWMADYCFSCKNIPDPEKIVFINTGTTTEPNIIATCPVCGSEVARRLLVSVNYIGSSLLLPLHLSLWIWWTKKILVDGIYDKAPSD